MYSCYCEPPEPAFKLNDLYLNTFCKKLKFRKRELILNGSDLYYLKGRRLNDSDLVIICEWLREHPDVVSLDFSYNSFTDEGARILAQFLENATNIIQLNLMFNDIKAQGVKEFTDLGNKLQVRSLRLNGNKIGEEGGKFIASLLQSNSSLLHLDIAETDQNATSLAYIFTALREDQNSKTNLKLLDISRPLGYGYYKYDSHHAMEAIGNMLKFNSFIVELHLQKMGIDCSDIPLLIMGLKNNKTLMLLDLQANYIGCDGAEALGSWLETSTLRGLMLSHNNIDDLGATALCYKLPSSRIKLLDLAHNKMTAKGLLFLVDTLKKVAKLEILYIWGNKFSDQVCRRIKRMLLSGVLTQNNLDVKVYQVDGVNYPAFYSVDRYKHIYYCVGDYGFPQPIGISQPHENLIPTQMLHQSLTKKRRGSRICPQAVKLIDELDMEKKANERSELLSIEYGSGPDCRITSLYSLESSRIFQQESQTFDTDEEQFSLSEESEGQNPVLLHLKRKKIKELIQGMKERKQLEMKERCYKNIKSIIAETLEGISKMQTQEKYGKKYEPTASHEDISKDINEKAEYEAIAVQTSLPVLRSQYYSFELRSNYPLTSYSIAEMELAKRNKIDILADVQEAYIRKYEQPNILQEENYDLCNDPYYSINDSPLIITHSDMDKEPEPEEELEQEELQEEILAAEAESTESEKEQYLQPMYSAYEILEHNIHGVPITTPLSKDAKEALLQKHTESSTSSETQETVSVHSMMDQRTQTGASLLSQ